MFLAVYKNILNGTMWFLLAALLGSAIPILGKLWFFNLLSALFTSFIVYGLFYKLINAKKGKTFWYILPFIIIPFALLLFGLLCPVLWGISNYFFSGYFGIDKEAFLMVPMVIFIYGILLIPVLYPFTLLTQFIFITEFKIRSKNQPK